MYTKKDVDYHGPEILEYATAGEEELFADEFFKTAIGETLARKGLGTETNFEIIAADAKYQNRTSRVSFEQFVRSAEELYRIGELQPDLAPVVEVDNRERDVNGRLMSPKAIQWKRWQEWCNDPKTSMKEIQDLRRSNAAFAEFYADQSRQERSGGVGDAVEAFGTEAVRSDKSAKRTEELRLFAQQYRTTSADEVKRLSSKATNPSAEGYIATVNRCIEAGLL